MPLGHITSARTAGVTSVGHTGFKGTKPLVLLSIDFSLPIIQFMESIWFANAEAMY